MGGVRSAGIKLTDTFASFPTAAVSGFYFSHPRSQYFGVGKIDRDKATSYAQRKGMRVAEAERWLAPILGYDPDPAPAAEAATADAAKPCGPAELERPYLGPLRTT